MKLGELDNRGLGVLPALKSPFAPSHCRETDGDGNVGFRASPSNPDAISPDLEVRHFAEMDRQHTRLLPPSRVVQHCLKLTQVNRPFIAILVRSDTRICPCGSREGRNNIRPDAAPYLMRAHPRSAGPWLPRTSRVHTFNAWKSDPPAKWRGDRPSKADGPVQEMFAQHLETAL